jgi:hypothetical protein
MAQDLYAINVPEIGVINGGFDWKQVSSLESFSSELNRLASSEDPSWYASIKSDDDEAMVAFAQKAKFKKTPISGVSILRNVLKDDKSFISLIALDEDRYWLLYLEEGVPYCSAISQSTDYIADDAGDVLVFLRNILSSKKAASVPIYSDCRELLEEINLELDIRDFSLEYLSESLKAAKTKIEKYKFSRYSRLPVIKISIGVLLLSLLGGGLWYWQDSSSKDLEAQKRQRQAEIRRSKQELAQQVDAAINATPHAKKVLPLYMSGIGTAPPLISGWALSAMNCERNSCMLTYKAKSFATWRGYLDAKPKKWPEPIFGVDTTVVYQPLGIDVPEIPPRTVQELSPKSNAVMDIGNLSQIVKEVGVDLKMLGEPTRVAGNGLGPDAWIPYVLRFTVSGPGHLASALMQRLPDGSGLKNLDFKVADVVTFEMTGEVYANP